jgi:hypothetical protein
MRWESHFLLIRLLLFIHALHDLKYLAHTIDLSNALYKLSNENVEEYRYLMALYVKNAWSTKYLAVFKYVETADRFISPFSLLGLPKDWVKLSVLVGQAIPEKVG